MSNTLLTVSMITKKAVAMFRNSNAFLQVIDRQYDSEYMGKDYKIGDTLRIRLPVDYTVGSSAVVTPQTTVEQQTTVVVSNQKNVTTSFTSADFTLKIDDFSDRFLAKMVNNLAAKVAQDVMSLANGVPNLVHAVDGSGNTISPTMDTWLLAGATLDLLSADRDGERKAILDPLSQARTVSSFAGLFNPTSQISDQYRKGAMGGVGGTLGIDDWRMDQTAIKFAQGDYGTLPHVDGASQTGTVLTVSSISNAIPAGTVITIAGVNSVNRLTKEDNGSLAQFVVTQTASSGTTLHIYPALIPPDMGADVQYQTVTASPGSTAAITAALKASETVRKNLVFRKEAFTLVVADLPLIRNGVVKSARENYDGISLRMVEGYDVYNDLFVDRLDILYGYASPRSDWCVIVADKL